MAEANQWVYGLNTLAVGPSAESLADTGFVSSVAWQGANDWSDVIAGNTTYTHSAGNGQLTQLNANLAVVPVALKPYRLTYVLSSITGAATMTMTLVEWGGTISVSLPIVAGANTVFFTSGALTTGDMEISVISTGAGGFTMDDLTLTHGSAEAVVSERKEVLDFTVRAEKTNTGTITVVEDAFGLVGVPLNADDVGSWSAQDIMDTLDISNLFFRASVATDGFHWQYRK